jgi:signal peptidase I
LQIDIRSIFENYIVAIRKTLTPHPHQRGVNSKTLLRDLLEVLLLTALFYTALNGLTGRYRVLSVSMQPTLNEGQQIIVSKTSYWLHQPERGDIVVIKPREPNNQESIPLIKRIIGLPHEYVEAHDGRIWINGRALNEPYVSAPLDYTVSWRLGADEYVVLGDNRNNSSDSHSWGAISKERIIGKAVFRYWPLEKLGGFPDYDF